MPQDPMAPLNSGPISSDLEKTGFSAGFRRQILILAGIAIYLVLMAARYYQVANNPSVFLLSDDVNAKWIHRGRPFEFRLRRQLDPSDKRKFEPNQVAFRFQFDLPKTVSQGRLNLQAFRQFQIWLDADPRTSSAFFTSERDLNEWKREYDIRLPELAPGRHEIWIIALNRGAHPAIKLSSEQLDIHTNADWEATVNGREWTRAVLACDTRTDLGPLLDDYPSVAKSFRLLWPWLAVVFGATFLCCYGPFQQLERPNRPTLSPSIFRWGLLCLWLIMAMNNIARIPSTNGFDVDEHLNYVKFVAERGKLPLATDGWQMFQSPLIYVLAAPFYALFAENMGSEGIVKLLRFLPLLCGLAQIEICFRAGRAVFPDRRDLQVVVTAVGGLMPMNIYMSQAFCNEPLAGCLSSLVLLFCFSLIIDPDRPRNFRYFGLMGFVWGLALLSKLSPILLAPLILTAVFVADRKNNRWLQSGIAHASTVFTASFLVAGWYYIRNWLMLGKPFVGGWDPAIGILWWQDPSYRTWNQISSFGKALHQPVCSGSQSFWDGFYSSMWTDGFTSGVIGPPSSIPWNLPWMAIGSWLALIPLGCILAGFVTVGKCDFKASRNCLVFSAAAVILYVTAVLDLYIHVPVYSQVKASYTLGILPCYAILAGAGAEPLLRIRWLRAAFFAGLGCWAVAAYAAYFCFTRQ